METLLEILRSGEWTQDNYTLHLKNGTALWTANGAYSLAFYPKSGAGFTFSEKRKLMKAIKEGRMKQAITPPHQEEGNG